MLCYHRHCVLPIAGLSASSGQPNRHDDQGDDDDGPNRYWSTPADLGNPALGLSSSPSATRSV
jgi:hypothetical protein